MKGKIRWIQNLQFEAETENGHKIKMDAPKTSHGDDTAPTPMQYVLLGTAGCTAFDVVVILKKKKQNVKNFEVEVSAKRADTHPKVFTEIEILYKIYGENISEKAVEQAIKLSKEKYCSASIMIGKTAKITTRYEIIEA
ncbi:OsmC family protein [Thermotomaculum hydrothermale]|uniref:OsmC family protein n=1 Tax=Thermotomaculum hydrothermale TaxID=981385 RepID=A0A7R6SXF3_9BACT|nr:OsmC family protein [Thermotomaculum hydrothermale]BBB31724.1 OsmC family protein [Thermotomaculum hydrothermale]